MRSRERQSEIMDWIERSNCDICAVNETGLTGEEYMEVGDGYSGFAANREWTKGRSGGAGFIIKKGIRYEEMRQDGRCMPCKNRTERPQV